MSKRKQEDLVVQGVCKGVQRFGRPPVAEYYRGPRAGCDADRLCTHCANSRRVCKGFKYMLRLCFKPQLAQCTLKPDSLRKLDK
jgi:hypothetical protein